MEYLEEKEVGNLRADSMGNMRFFFVLLIFISFLQFERDPNRVSTRARSCGRVVRGDRAISIRFGLSSLDGVLSSSEDVSSSVESIWSSRSFYLLPLTEGSPGSLSFAAVAAAAVPVSSFTL